MIRTCHSDSLQTHSTAQLIYSVETLLGIDPSQRSVIPAPAGAQGTRDQGLLPSRMGPECGVVLGAMQVQACGFEHPSAFLIRCRGDLV